MFLLMAALHTITAPGWSFVAFVSVDGLMAIQRAGFPAVPRWHGWMVIATSLDVMCAALLALVFVHAKRRNRVVMLVVEKARRSADEYARARRDYEQLVRHRIGNPLAVVQGVAQTLEAYPQLPREQREELIRALVASAEQLVTVSLDPRTRTAEEHGLVPVPTLLAVG